MKTLLPSQLSFCDIDFQIADIFPENWLQRKEFSLYKNKPRPHSALFFVCSDIEVSFFHADGTLDKVAQNGDIVFIPRGICYYVRVLGDTGQKIDTYTVNLHLFDAAREEFLLSSEITVLARCQDHRQEIHLKKLCEVFHREKRNLTRTKSEIFSLLDLIGTLHLQNDDYYYPIRRGAKAFCEEWNKNKKIEEYAQMDGVSVTYFYRCFRNWSGSSPVEYRNTRRLSNAESLLRCTDMKIREISEIVGFEDPFYFCHLFRKSYGASPKQYRAAYQV